MNPDAPEESEETTGPQTEAGRQAVTGLRTLWNATGQMQEEFVRLECRPDDAEGCAASVGFGGLADVAENAEPTTNTGDAITRLRSGWKNQLAREGKLHDPEASALKPTEAPTEEVAARPE